MATSFSGGAESVCMDFNPNPRINENRELLLNQNEELLFQSVAGIDNEEFGSEGTVFFTNTRLAFISENGNSFETPHSTVGAHGVTNSELFVQLCCDPPHSFSWRFSDETTANVANEALLTIGENEVYDQSQPEPSIVNSNMAQIFMGQMAVDGTDAYDNQENILQREEGMAIEPNQTTTGNAMMGFDVSQLNLATTMNDFNSGGWITAENAHLFNETDFPSVINENAMDE